MNKSINEYMSIDECIQYVTENRLFKINKKSFRDKFKHIDMQQLLANNMKMHNKIIYIKRSYVDEQITLYKNSIFRPTAIRKIVKIIDMPNISYQNINGCITYKLNNYFIPLYSRDKTFISKSDFDSIIQGVDHIRCCQCITRKELLDKANNMFQGISFGPSEKNIFGYIANNNLEYFTKQHIGNVFLNGSLYPKDTVESVISHLYKFVKEKKVTLINISFEEYLSLTDNEFKEQYKELNDEELNMLCINLGDGRKNRNFSRNFKETNVKVILINKGATFVSKKEFEEFCDFKKNYIDNEYLQQFGFSLKSTMAKNNNIVLRKHKKKYFMHKNDVDKYLHIARFNEQFTNAKSIYDRFLIKIEFFPHKKEEQFPKLKKLFIDFVKWTNAKSKSLSYVSRMFNVYNKIFNYIFIDLEPFNTKENNRLFEKVITVIGQSQNERGILISFINYLINLQGFELEKMSNDSKKITKEPYSEEEFLNLLIQLIEIVANKEKIQKLYRDWNLSSCITYLFMHYCVAWRKMDLVEQLPMPSLRSIEQITDGESFIKWLEDGNELSEDISYKICKSLEDRTNRLKLKAKKNNAYLNCVISSALVNEVALLLCINAANREIHFSKNNLHRYEHRSFNLKYTQNRNIDILLKDNFNIDINSILQDGFDNVKMNKGFLNLVKEKSEELGIAYSYYYAQVARGHLARRDVLSETTKIYLKKEISTSSVMAFAIGTMGSVAYNLLELVDKEFKYKSHENKIKDIQKLNMTPYSIERNIRTITNKISVMRNEIDNFFKEGGYKVGLLQDILYGQNCYGIEEKTKCLIKITRKNNLGITRIKSSNYDELNFTNKYCPFNRMTCIGCAYMIALRYFIYEFEKKFNNVLDDLEHSTTKIDKEIAIDSINELYLPVLNDLEIILGDNINKVIDINKYLTLAERT